MTNCPHQYYLFMNAWEKSHISVNHDFILPQSQYWYMKKENSPSSYQYQNSDKQCLNIDVSQVKYLYTCFRLCLHMRELKLYTIDTSGDSNA